MKQPEFKRFVEAQLTWDRAFAQGIDTDAALKAALNTDLDQLQVSFDRLAVLPLHLMDGNRGKRRARRWGRKIVGPTARDPQEYGDGYCHDPSKARNDLVTHRHEVRPTPRSAASAGGP